MATGLSRHWRAQRGQSLIEALLGIAVLAVLMLLIVIIGKYQAVSLAAAQAARTVAFDCAVLPEKCTGRAPDPQLADRVRSALTGTAGPDHHHAALWTTRRGEALLEQASDVSMILEHPAFDAGANIAGSSAASRLAGGVRFLSDKAGPGRFGLDIAGGIVRPTLAISLLASRGEGAPAQILDGMPLRPRAQLAILGDGWNASGPVDDSRSVHARADKGAQLPGGIEYALDAVYLVTKLAIRFMHELKLEDLTMDFKRPDVDNDIVPPDRLPAQPGANP